MLSPRLTSCGNCTDISILLRLIDCKVSEISHLMYYNTIYGLNNCVKEETIADLINYKRILYFKSCNSDYAGCISFEQIASRIKVLTAGCKPKCCDPCINLIITEN